MPPVMVPLPETVLLKTPPVMVPLLMTSPLNVPFSMVLPGVTVALPLNTVPPVPVMVPGPTVVSVGSPSTTSPSTEPPLAKSFP